MPSCPASFSTQSCPNKQKHCNLNFTKLTAVSAVFKTEWRSGSTPLNASWCWKSLQFKATVFGPMDNNNPTLCCHPLAHWLNKKKTTKNLIVFFSTLTATSLSTSWSVVWKNSSQIMAQMDMTTPHTGRHPCCEPTIWPHPNGVLLYYILFTEHSVVH